MEAAGEQHAAVAAEFEVVRRVRPGLPTVGQGLHPLPRPDVPDVDLLVRLRERGQPFRVRADRHGIVARRAAEGAHRLAGGDVVQRELRGLPRERDDAASVGREDEPRGLLRIDRRQLATGRDVPATHAEIVVAVAVRRGDHGAVRRERDLGLLAEALHLRLNAADLAAARDVPHADRPVAGRRDREPAVGREVRAVDHLGMADLHVRHADRGSECSARGQQQRAAQHQPPCDAPHAGRRPHFTTTTGKSWTVLGFVVVGVCWFFVSCFTRSASHVSSSLIVTAPSRV